MKNESQGIGHNSFTNNLWIFIVEFNAILCLLERKIIIQTRNLSEWPSIWPSRQHSRQILHIKWIKFNKSNWKSKFVFSQQIISLKTSEK